MFYEDALTAARALELTLTSRSKFHRWGDPDVRRALSCGRRLHRAPGEKGFRVAVCEQMEDPKKAKGIVRREVVRVVSPGTLTDVGYLDAREPAFLMALVPSSDAPGYGVALIDLSTGEFSAAEYLGTDAGQALADELAVLRPREIVASPALTDLPALVEGLRIGALITRADDWTFEFEAARRSLLDQLKTQSLHAFGLDGHRRHLRRRCARAVPARDTEGRPGAPARDRVPRRRRCLTIRSDHASQPRGDRGRDRRPCGIAAR